MDTVTRGHGEMQRDRGAGEGSWGLPRAAAVRLGRHAVPTLGKRSTKVVDPTRGRMVDEGSSGFPVKGAQGRA